MIFHKNNNTLCISVLCSRSKQSLHQQDVRRPVASAENIVRFRVASVLRKTDAGPLERTEQPLQDGTLADHASPALSVCVLNH